MRRMTMKLPGFLLFIALAVPSATSWALPVNVAQGAPVTLVGVYGVITANWPFWPDSTVYPVAAASTLTDGVFRPASTEWQDGTVWWDDQNRPSAGNYVEVDLGGMHTLMEFVVQADNNDTYRLQYFDTISSSWLIAWDIPAVGGYGMQTRTSPIVSLTTDKLRFFATGGDHYYSVSEIQAFENQAAVPEPSTVLLVSAGLVGLGVWGRKRMAK